MLRGCRRLKARATLEGLSLSDYLLREVEHAAERPTISEQRERLNHLLPMVPDVSPADAVREERDRR